MKIDRLLRPISFPTLLGAAVLAVACASPTTSGSPPGPSATPEAATPTPVALATESPNGAARPCTDADLTLEHGFADGAAGSRFTIMNLTVSGPEECSLPAIPTIRLVDATGEQVAIGAPAGEITTIEVQPGTVLQSTIQFNNWCEDVTAEPLTLVVIVDDLALPVSGGPFPNPGGLPPCMGAGGPLLESSPWRIPQG
jgi:hypothetical protein